MARWISKSMPRVRNRSSPVAVLAQHADCGVTRARELLRDLQQAVEHDIGIELGTQ